MSKASKKASKDHVLKRPSKTHHHRSKPVKGEVRPLVEAPVVELEISEPEKSAYEHGLHRYLKEAPPSFQYKTEILTTDALPPERSCFRRNLPGILFASLVLLFTLVVFVEVAANKGGAETNLFYPTPETTTVEGSGNSTDENGVDDTLVPGEGQQLFTRNDEAR